MKEVIHVKLDTTELVKLLELLNDKLENLGERILALEALSKRVGGAYQVIPPVFTKKPVLQEGRKGEEVL